MRTFKIILLTVVVLPLFSLNTYSLTYTSLEDGDWNNTTTVWSLDGITPCGCSAPLTISGHTVNINHSINQKSTLKIINGSIVNISSTGALIGPTYKFVLTSGTVTVNGGFTNILRLDIAISGTFDATDSRIEVEEQVNVYGTMTVNDAIVELGAGNFTVQTGGYASFEGGSYLITHVGNIFVDPAATLHMDDCCLIANGNINNDGTVSGTGVVQSLFGNVDNNGTWSVNVDWCVPGSSSGMPIAEDCSYVQATCDAIYTAVTLPIDLVLFDANETQERKVEVEWVTANEVNNDFFTVENSVDRVNWNIVTIIPGAGNSSSTLSYMYLDEDPQVGVSYYRLKQTDHDGSYAYSDIRAVDIQGEALSQFIQFVELFPNPTTGSITWTLNTAITGEYRLSIYDKLSRKVMEKDLYLVQGLNSMSEDISALSNGTYSLVISAKNAQNIATKTLMINK